MTTETEQPLDFVGLLCELQALLGRPVSIEAALPNGRVYLAAFGTLAGALDLALDSPGGADRPARLAFYLERASAHFVLREDELRAARAFSLAPAGAASIRVIEIELAGAGQLLVAELEH